MFLPRIWNFIPLQFAYIRNSRLELGKFLLLFLYERRGAYVLIRTSKTTLDTNSQQKLQGKTFIAHFMHFCNQGVNNPFRLSNK